jgi:hypothetical protein
MQYTTLTGHVLDLSALAAEQRAFFDRCAAAARDGMPWGEFAALITSDANPLVRAAGGSVTRSVWDHPLFQAVRDLEDRIGLRAGELAPQPGIDPGNGLPDDVWAPASERQ